MKRWRGLAALGSLALLAALPLGAQVIGGGGSGNATAIQGTPVAPGTPGDGTCLVFSAASAKWSASSCSGSASTAWSALTPGTNTAGAFYIGTGASLAASGSGAIVATSTTGNAATATALAATPTQCSGGQFATGVAASGNANCATPSGGMTYPGAGVPNSTGSAWGTSYTVGTSGNDLVQLTGAGALPPVSAANLTSFPTLNQSTTGNAGTATALAATPSQCTSGQFATGIAASGNANCSTPSGGTTITSWVDPLGSGSAGSTYNGGSANGIGCYEVFIPNSFTLGHFVLNVTTADGSNNNDVGLYTAGGTRLAHIGAQTLGSTGVQDFAIAGGGTITESAGAYFLCITTPSGTLRLQGGSNQIGPNGTVLVSATTSTGGALPATISVPTIVWQTPSRTPSWAFH